MLLYCFIVSSFLALYLLRANAFILIFYSFLLVLSFAGQIVFYILDIKRSSDDLIFGIGLLLNFSAIFAIIIQRLLVFLPRKKVIRVAKQHRKKLFLTGLILILPTAYAVTSNFSKAMLVHRSGYIEGYGEFSAEGLSSSTLLPLVLLFSFINLNKYFETKKLIFILVFFTISLSFLLYGARSFLVYSILTSLAFLLANRTLALGKSLIGIFLTVVLLLYIGNLREGGGNLNLLLRVGVEFSSIPLILGNLDVMTDLSLPISDIVLSILPHRVVLTLGLDAPASLATLFVVNHDPGWAEAGGGFGFSLIAEILVRFGYLLFPFIILMIFMIIDKIEQSIIRHPHNTLYKSALLCIYTSVLMLPRGDVIEVARSISFFVIVLLISKLVFSKRA